MFQNKILKKPDYLPLLKFKTILPTSTTQWNSLYNILKKPKTQWKFFIYCNNNKKTINCIIY